MTRRMNVLSVSFSKAAALSDAPFAIELLKGELPARRHDHAAYGEMGLTL